MIFNQAALHTSSTIAIVALVTVAVASDLRTRRIPNWLTMSGLAIALILRAVAGLEPFLAGLLGAAIALGLTLPLVFLGGLGGGDSKFLMAVGAFLGPPGLPVALAVTAIVGGMLAVATILYRGVFGATLGHTWTLVHQLVRRNPEQPLRTLRTPGAIAVPYGVAIGAGALAGWMV